MNCGCFSSGDHGVFTNCLKCGRIHCSQECDATQCLHCKAPLGAQLPKSDDEDYDVAVKTKDRLLQFDREHAKRTHVFDSEGDYYSNDQWLSEDEKKAAAEKERKRREALNDRGRAKGFSLSVTHTGRIVLKDVYGPDSDADDDEGSADDDGDDDTKGALGLGALRSGSDAVLDGQIIGGGTVGRAATVYQALQESMNNRHMSALERQVDELLQA